MWLQALLEKFLTLHPGKHVLLDGFPRSLDNARDWARLFGPPEACIKCVAYDVPSSPSLLRCNHAAARCTCTFDDVVADATPFAVARHFVFIFHFLCLEVCFFASIETAIILPCDIHNESTYPRVSCPRVVFFGGPLQGPTQMADAKVKCVLQRDLFFPG